MCGIAGFSVSDSSFSQRESTLTAMLRELRFRGPDAEESYFGNGIALGHRRLRVIDPESGNQPMTDPDALATVSFNGEIYNYRELRHQLESQGVRFKTRSDTEVLLQGYLRWGTGIVERLCGMFALSIWDHASRSLLLARDRLGVKPLVWAPLPGSGIVFASELGAIAASRLLSLTLNRHALAHYLSLGYVAGEQALLEPVRRLPPGSYLLWKPGTDPKIETYWDLAEIWTQAPRRTESVDDLQAQFGELLSTATQQRLVSDVPVGVFLSGGLDSTVTAALMKRYLGQVESFSVGFSEPSYDESDWSRLAAKELGTRHHLFDLNLSDAGLIQEISSRQDEPFADTSIVPTYFLCQQARKSITVALSGDGADELLAGYPTQRATRLQSRLGRLPHWVINPVRGVVHFLPDSDRKVNFSFKAKQFVSGLDRNPCDAHAGWRMLATPASAQELLRSELRTTGADTLSIFRRAYDEVPSLTALDRFLYVDYKTWLLDDILVKLDRASMAHGLEIRSPFLDHRLVEFCAGLPESLKLRGQGKYLLRGLATPLIPSPILHRRKSGFNAPVSQWLRGPWRELVNDALSKSQIEKTGILTPPPVDKMLTEHATGRRDHGHRLFSLLMLQLWLQRRI